MYYSSSLITWKNYQFLVTSAPDDAYMKKCISDLQKNNVKQLVRACDLTYDETMISNSGVAINEIKFDDGGVPSEE